jgi:hypothetical protein
MAAALLAHHAAGAVRVTSASSRPPTRSPRGAGSDGRARAEPVAGVRNRSLVTHRGAVVEAQPGCPVPSLWLWHARVRPSGAWPRGNTGGRAARFATACWCTRGRSDGRLRGHRAHRRQPTHPWSSTPPNGASSTSSSPPPRADACSQATRTGTTTTSSKAAEPGSAGARTSELHTSTWSGRGRGVVKAYARLMMRGYWVRRGAIPQGPGGPLDGARRSPHRAGRWPMNRCISGSGETSPLRGRYAIPPARTSPNPRPARAVW